MRFQLFSLLSAPLLTLLWSSLPALAQLNQAWVNRYNNGPVVPTTEAGAKILSDSAGNTYAIGSSDGGISRNIVVVKYSSVGTPQWTNRYFGPAVGVSAPVTAVFDTSGNVIVAGYSMGANGSFDYVTLKYNSSGVPQWTNRFDGPLNGDDQARGVAVDGSGNVFVAGFSQGVGTSYDYATIKYSSAGTALWTNRYNGPGGSSDQAFGIGVDGSGNAIVTGQSTGSGSGFDYATIKYSSAGSGVWTNRYSSTGNRSDTAYALFVDSGGTVYVTGSSVVTNTGSDMVTIRYNSTGTVLWTNRYNGPGNSTDKPNGVVVDGSGSVFVTGESQGSFTSTDMATVKYDASGTPQWTNRYNSAINGSDAATAIALDNSGDVYVAGYSQNNFGGQDYALLRLTSATGSNAFVRTYNGPTILGDGDDAAASVAVDSLGNAYVTGNSVSTNTGPDMATLKFDPGGLQLWVARYNDYVNGNDEAVATATDTEGNIYVAGKSVGLGTGLDFLVIKHNAAGTPVWTNRYSGAANGDDVAVGVAVNSAGGVFVTGADASGNIVTIKYEITGVPLWTNSYTGPSASAAPAALALDAAGNAFVTGGSVNAAGNRDYITLKIASANGALLWTNSYNGPGSGDDEAAALSLDAAGNVLVTGHSLNAAGDDDFATLKINGATGATLWVSRYNGPVSDFDLAVALAVDATGNVIVGGSSIGPAFYNDYAVVKYNSNGAPQWTNRYDGPAVINDELRGVAVDSGGNALVTGYTFTTDPFDIANPNGSVKDYATIKYGSAGVALWTNRFNGPATNKNDDAVALAVDASGNVFVTGASVGLATGEDYATVAYNAAGAAFSTNRYSGPGSGVDWPATLRMRGRYNVIVTGRSAGESGDTDYATLLYYQTNAANAAPTASSQTTGTLEDTPLNITLDGSDPNGDPVHFIIVNGPTNGALTTLAPTLTYVPNPGYYGPDNITFRVSDGLLNSANASVSITVSNVNSPPVLSPFFDLTFTGVSSPQTVPFTITHPANEGAQFITITATSDNPGLIPSPLGVIYTSGDATGLLQFTPVGNGVGSAVITVTAQDNGGTAFGGADRTVETFVINAFRPLTTVPRDGFPVANGAVNALLETNGVLYMGGAFTEVGTNSGRAAAFRTTNGAPIAGFPVIERSVQAVVSDGAGGWYVGGDFTSVGGMSRLRLARILASGLVDTNFIANVDASVSALSLSGTNLFVGGSFVRVTNVTPAGLPVATNDRLRFAVLDKDTGVPRDLGSNPQFDRQVLAIQPYTNNTVFVGGIFSNIVNITAGPVTNTNSRISLAAISLTNGLPTAFLADCRQATNGGATFTNAVRALAFIGTNLYVGGEFSYITNSFNFVSNTIVPPTNGVSGVEQRTGMARLDALSGTVITNFRADMNARVRTLFAVNTNVFVGGEFTSLVNRLGVSATNRNRLAALNFTNGFLRSWDPSVNGTVRSLTVMGTNVFVGGDFTTVNTNRSLRRRFAAFGTNVNLVGTNMVVAPISPDMSANVNTVAAAGGVVFAGGDFNFYGGELRSRAAAVDLSSYEILPWNPDPNNTVLALTMIDTNIAIGGTFTALRFTTTPPSGFRFALVNTNDGDLRPGFTNGNFDNTVRALAASGNRLFVGGDFGIVTNRVGGFENPRFRLAALDLDLNGTLAPDFSADVLGANVSALLVSDNTLYVGGDYTNIAGVARSRLTAIDTGSGSVLPGFVADSGPGGTAVTALHLRGTNLYVGGSFTIVTNAGFVTATRNRLMSLNPATGGFYSWNPVVNNTVNAITTIGTNVYIGGAFSGASSVGSLTRNRLAEISFMTGVATPMHIDFDSTVSALAASEGRLFAGGAFTFTASSAGPAIRLRPFMAAFDSTGSTNNVAPVMNPVANLTIREDAATTNLLFTGISAGPTNESSQTIELTAASSNPGLIPDPTVNYTSPNSTAQISFAPVADAFGVSTITVTLRDSGGTAGGGVDTTVNTFLVTILSVNDTPTLATLGSLTLNEDAGFQTVNLSGINSGAANEGSQTISVTATNTNPALITSLTPNYSSPNSTGTLTFIPAANGFGTATVSVVVSDNGGTANGAASARTNTFTIAITAVNDAPGLNPISNRTTNQNSGPVTVNLTGINTGPSETNQVITSITATSSNSGLVPNPITVNYTSGTSGSLVFSPAANATGTTTISVVVRDDGGTAGGGRDATTNTFTVAFVPVNAPPTLNAIASVTITEDASQQTINLSGITPGPTNEVGQGLTVTAFSGNTNVIADPSVNYTSPNPAGSISFTPLTNTSGTVTLTVIVTDTGGTATGGINAVTNSFTVTVTTVNDPPLIAALTNTTVLEDSGLRTVVLSGLSPGPTNENAQTLSFTAISSSTALVPNPSVNHTNGNTTALLSFTPATNATGTATVTLVVADNGGTAAGGVNSVTNSFTITITPINDPPVLNALASLTLNEDAAPQTVNLAGVAAGPADESGQTFFVAAVWSSDTNLVVITATNHATSSTTGTLAFRPVTNAFGTATISVWLRDSGGTATGGVDSSTNTFAVVVSPVNDPPVFTPAASFTIAEDSGAQTVNVAGIAAGPANESAQTLVLAAVSSNTGLVPNPSVNYTSGNATGSLSFTPATNASGAATLTVTLTDSGGTATGGVNAVTNTFTVTISAVNDAPTLTAIANLTVSEGADQQTVNLSGISTGPADESAQTLILTASSSNASVIPAPSINFTNGNATAVLAFTPAPGTNGTVTLSVVVTDSGGTANGGVNAVTNTFAVTVQPAGSYTLVINRAGGAVTLAWPTNATGFLLQSSDDLSAWSNVSGTPAVVGGQNMVTNSSMSATNLFYRLRKP